MVPLDLGEGGGGEGGGLLSYIQGLYRFLNKKFKYFTFPIFQGLHQCEKAHGVYVFVRFSTT